MWCFKPTYGDIHFLRDIDETELVIQVRCMSCKEVREEHIIAEDMGDFTDNHDGTYHSLTGECATCLGA